MTDDTWMAALARLLDAKLSRGDRDLLCEPPPAFQAEDYDKSFERVASKVRGLADLVSRNEKRMEGRYKDLDAFPEGRRQTLLGNSPPHMLVALTHHLIRESYSGRFSEDRGKSVRLASLAVASARLVAETGFLSVEAAADLEAEALAYLGNARRLSSDLRGAQQAFEEARRLAEQGTGDRSLKALLSRLKAELEHDKGHLREAMRLQDRAIALWRMLKDNENLGRALLNRGRTAAWMEPLSKTCDFLREAATLIEDPHVTLLCLFPLGEVLAREGEAFEAWRVVCQADNVLFLLDGGTPQAVTRQRWIKGLTYRANGQWEAAEEELEAARVTFEEEQLPFLAAQVSLDLAGVYAAQGRIHEVKAVARNAHAVFVAENVEPEALAALLFLQRAAEAENVTEAIATYVANFIARFQHNKRLRFEPPE